MPPTRFRQKYKARDKSKAQSLLLINDVKAKAHENNYAGLVKSARRLDGRDYPAAAPNDCDFLICPAFPCKS